MLREVARRIATAVILVCAAIMAFSIVVALAYKGELGPLGNGLRTLDFEAWVAAFEIALSVGGVALVALLMVRTDEGPSVAEQPAERRTLPDACPSCNADLSDLAAGPEDPFPECPNCGLDLLEDPTTPQAQAEAYDDEPAPDTPTGVAAQ
jgi:hypothetical protein